MQMDTTAGTIDILHVLRFRWHICDRCTPVSPAIRRVTCKLSELQIRLQSDHITSTYRIGTQVSCKGHVCPVWDAELIRRRRGGASFRRTKPGTHNAMRYPQRCFHNRQFHELLKGVESTTPLV